MIIRGLVIADAIVIAAQRVIAHALRGRAIPATRPTEGVRAADDGSGQKAHGVVAIEERVVVARTIAVEVAEAIRVISPARVAGADKKRSAGIAAETANAETCRRMAIAIEKGIIIAGAEKRTECCCSEKKILFHINHGTREGRIYSKQIRVVRKIRDESVPEEPTNLHSVLALSQQSGNSTSAPGWRNW